MEYKEYSGKEFDRWCADHMIEDNFGLWDFIKNQKVMLQVNTDEHGDKASLLINVKLI